MAKVYTEENFEKEVLQSDLPVLVDFWATWCAPCRQIAPLIDHLSDELAGQVNVGKVDVQECQALAGGYGVRPIPTLLIFKGGQVVDTIIGLQPKEVILAKLRAAM